MDLKGKSVVVGVCGGIAAYKVVEVVSRLKKLGAEVDVIMTANAQKFVTPLTFRSLSHRPVVTDMFSEPEHWEIKHVSLARKADLFIVAPATANIIGKLAAGIADDMLSTTLIATRAPVLIVPAMNNNMYANAVVQRNIKTLRKLGYMFMEPESGMLAEGTSGKGRLPEPPAIVDRACSILSPNKDLGGIRMIVTAGPTRENIDPVRFLSNYSSGKMGYAVAQAAHDRGAEVLLISGPAELECPDGVKLVRVNTAEEMYDAVLGSFGSCDVVVMAAAVADYRLTEISETKIKKTSDELVLKLRKNPDILEKLGMIKENRILVGFSAETDHLTDNAVMKLESKTLT